MSDEKLNIEKMKEYIINKKVYWTKHCLNRLTQRNISIADVKNVVNTGKIIEYYYDDYPHPSCLIFGYGINNQLLHIVCGISDDYLHMITAYYPSDELWNESKEIRRDL